MHRHTTITDCANLIHCIQLKFHAANTSANTQILKIQTANSEKYAENETRQHAIGRALGELIDCLSRVIPGDANSEVSSRFKALVNTLKDNTDFNIIEDISTYHAEVRHILVHTLDIQSLNGTISSRELFK